jgi:hypothetical protein
MLGLASSRTKLWLRYIAGSLQAFKRLQYDVQFNFIGRFAATSDEELSALSLRGFQGSMQSASWVARQ